jgi:hypothetical protein
VSVSQDLLAPCPYGPGTEGKILALQVRATAGLPLFVPGDCLEGLEPLPPREDVPFRPPLLECLILQTITRTPVSARALAVKLNRKLGGRFSQALHNLKDAGCIDLGRLGWRLVDVQL